MVNAWLMASHVQVQSARVVDDAAELFSVGSIRGFSMARRWAWFRNRVEVRLSVATRADWQAAYSFLRFALQQGFKAYSEDGGVMGPHALTDQAALHKGREQFIVDVGFLQHLVASSGDEGAYLPNGSLRCPSSLRTCHRSRSALRHWTLSRACSKKELRSMRRQDRHPSSRCRPARQRSCGQANPC
jgi:hypothetical protein